MFIDVYYLYLVIPALLFSLWAQYTVKTTFKKYSTVQSRRGITGAETARLLLASNLIPDVIIEQTAGSLTDHYDPGHKRIRLSKKVYASASLAAIGVAAHETGHALQHAQAWPGLAARSYLLPVASVGSTMGPYIALAGIFFGFPLLSDIGIFLFAGAVAFYIITLPVEFNASHRAITLLKSNGILSATELQGVQKVLSAAALTYVASAVTSIAGFVRLLLLSRNRQR